ncbi:MAG TPA: hypothetical protein P5044_09765 [bacterium]|nr:hypothetical protein [bacterium]
MSKETLFHGRKDYRLDPKGRIPFPSIWYAPLDLGESGKIVVTKGFAFDEKYLEVFSISKWSERMKLVDSFPEGKLKNKFMKWYVGSAETIELDNQNRLRLSKSLIDHAAIDKDVVLLGSIETVQIWSKELLEKAESVDEADFDMVFDLMNKARKDLAGRGE